VWDYNDGEVTHVGIGHTGGVTSVRISPDGRYIISVSNDGAIFRWKFPSSSRQAHPPTSTANEIPAAAPEKELPPANEGEEPDMEEASVKQDEE